MAPNADAGAEACLATTPLAPYLRSVYGAAGADAAAASSWDWREQRVIWLDLLSNASAQCLLERRSYDFHLYNAPVVGVSKAALSTALWQYRGSSCRADINFGGTRRRPVERTGAWLEVFRYHSDHRTFASFDRQGLWMYRAAGSGLWYYTGRTLEFQDTVDLAQHLNQSTKATSLFAWGKERLFKLAYKVLSPHYDTITFINHADGGMQRARRCGPKAQHGVYVSEVLALHKFEPRSCPPHPRMRSGWAPANRNAGNDTSTTARRLLAPCHCGATWRDRAIVRCEGVA